MIGAGNEKKNEKICSKNNKTKIKLEDGNCSIF
jgi:hypothetical protein